jgi:glycosyltransferase involved in cell wall biosynthesis
MEDLLIKRDEIIIINGFKGNKNLITLLMAFVEIKDHFPSWCIKVVGNNEGDQPHKMAIREFINNNELVGKVNLVGPTEDMEVEYATSKIHVIASLSEGCPTCVLEAMSCGIPSIGFEDCPGTNELILHNGNGILADSTDRIVGLRDSLYALMSNESLRQKLGQQALSDSAVFHPENVYDQWEELFYEASSYKNNLNKLFTEQVSIAPEATLHARRMRDYYKIESNKVL